MEDMYLEEATDVELTEEALARPDFNRELAHEYRAGRFDLKRLAKEIGVGEFKRVAESL